MIDIGDYVHGFKSIVQTCNENHSKITGAFKPESDSFVVSFHARVVDLSPVISHLRKFDIVDLFIRSTTQVCISGYCSYAVRLCAIIVLEQHVTS